MSHTKPFKKAIKNVLIRINKKPLNFDHPLYVKLDLFSESLCENNGYRIYVDILKKLNFINEDKQYSHFQAAY